MPALSHIPCTRHFVHYKVLFFNFFLQKSFCKLCHVQRVVTRVWLATVKSCHLLHTCVRVCCYCSSLMMWSSGWQTLEGEPTYAAQRIWLLYSYCNMLCCRVRLSIHYLRRSRLRTWRVTLPWPNSDNWWLRLKISGNAGIRLKLNWKMFSVTWVRVTCGL